MVIGVEEGFAGRDLNGLGTKRDPDERREGDYKYYMNAWPPCYPGDTRW
jgi:hypothetical protein